MAAPITEAEKRRRTLAGDRTVHAVWNDFDRTGGLVEVVRYDRSGKWYLEPIQGERRRVSVLEAAAEAVCAGGRIFLGNPGGSAFDRAVREAKGAT